MRVNQPWGFPGLRATRRRSHALTSHPRRVGRRVAARAAGLMLPTFFCAQAYAGYIVFRPESDSGYLAYSIDDIHDYLFFKTSRQVLITPHDALAPLTLTQLSQPTSPVRSVNPLQIDAAFAEGAVSFSNLNVTDANRGQTIEMERNTNHANIESDERRKIEMSYDPTAYADQYGYTTIGDYVQQSRLDIEPMYRDYTAVTPSVEMVETYIPQPQGRLQFTRPENDRIEISPFEATLPGRIYIWVTHPDNFTSLIFVLISGWAGLGGLNILLRTLAKKIRPRER